MFDDVKINLKWNILLQIYLVLSFTLHAILTILIVQII